VFQPFVNRHTEAASVSACATFASARAISGDVAARS
jgi:hypothetical protein